MARLDPERHRILRELDVEASFKFSHYRPPGGYNASGRFCDTHEIALAGLHRLRIQMRKAFTKEEVAASRAWLAEHGFEFGEHGHA